ncbi:MAG: hypothetical protein P4L59_03295 [Desulfosporosinus sp.]|nr:hypothetical protein [Desulfosporosinus sp.]
MLNIKHTFLVSALSLGLIVGTVGLASAATSMSFLGFTKGAPISTDANATPTSASAVSTPTATDTHSTYSINPDQTAQSSPQQTASQQPSSQPTFPQVAPQNPSSQQPVPRSNMHNHMAMQQSQTMHNGANGNGAGSHIVGNMGMGR